MTTGTLYVLANSAAPDLVAVGKTTGDSHTAALTLTQSIGVASPFLVVYDAELDDIDRAEAFVLEWLQDRGYRLVDSRGLFRAPIRDAVAALVSLQTRLDTSASITAKTVAGARTVPVLEEYDSTNDDDLPKPSSEWAETLEKADDLYYGFGDTLKDLRRAADHYKMAADQGSLVAYWRLGGMYMEGEGVRQHTSKAFDVLIDGAHKGSFPCYTKLAEIYLAANDSANAQKCLSLFLRGTKDPEYQFAKEMNIVFMEFASLLTRNSTFVRGLNSTVLQDLIRVRSEVVSHIDELIERFQERMPDPVAASVIDENRTFKEWLMKLR